MATRRTAWHLGLLTYRTCDLTGHGDHEEDTTEGYWTRDVDTWGKRTFAPLYGPELYLFPDEVVSWEPYSDAEAEVGLHFLIACDDDPHLRLGLRYAEGLARAFGTNVELWTNLDASRLRVLAGERR